MIVDFTIKNFRSLRDEQTLSFYAERLPHHLSGNIHYPSDDIGVLATAGISSASSISSALMTETFLTAAKENAERINQQTIAASEFDETKP